MLALVGSGEYLPPMEAVDRDLLKRLTAPPRIVCLPTAAGTEGPTTVAYWSELGQSHFARLGYQAQSLPVIDRASANNPDYASAVAAANFVYLSGGRPTYLYETLKGTLVWQAIQSVLAAGGLLSGCSAGAMIMGEHIVGFPRRHPGFDLLHRTMIIPHYDEIPSGMAWLARLLLGGGQTVIGVEGNTALVKSEAGLEVMGSGGVTIWNGFGRRRYLHGPLPADALYGAG